VRAPRAGRVFFRAQRSARAAPAGPRP